MDGLSIKLARIKAGMRQYELAARLSISPSQLSEIECGRRQPSPELLSRISNLLALDSPSSFQER